MLPRGGGINMLPPPPRVTQMGSITVAVGGSCTPIRRSTRVLANVSSAEETPAHIRQEMEAMLKNGI